MTISNVLLSAAAGRLDVERGPAAYALGLAASFRAHLTGVVFEPDVYAPAVLDPAAAAEAREAAEARRRATAACADKLREAASRVGVSVEVVTDDVLAYGIPAGVADHARLNDVTVAGVDPSGLLSEREIAEHVLFASGRPLIIVPADQRRGFAC
jgi:hypothetical protein